MAPQRLGQPVLTSAGKKEANLAYFSKRNGLEIICGAVN